MPLTIFSLHPNTLGAGIRKLLCAGTADRFGTGAGLMSQRGIDDGPIGILNGGNPAVAAGTHSEETTVVFTQNAGGFERVDLRNAFFHTSADNAEILGTNQGSTGQKHSKNKHETEKERFHKLRDWEGW